MPMIDPDGWCLCPCRHEGTDRNGDCTEARCGVCGRWHE